MNFLARWTVCLYLLAAVPATAQEWTRFRGPNGSGVGTAVVPVKWTDKDYNWKVEVPGTGHSSPVFWGDKLFLTSCEPKTGQRRVLCLNAANGQTLWSREFDAPRYPIHDRNNFASATPTVDEERLYVSWATPKQYLITTFDHDGKPGWTADLGPYRSRWGLGVSLILHEELLIVSNDQQDGSLIALDKKTGSQSWKLPRQAADACYATPCVSTARDGSTELIFTNAQCGVTALNPQTGKPNWAISVFDTQRADQRAIPCPVMMGDLVLATCGQSYGRKELVAVRPGNGTSGPQEVWRLEKGVPYLPTPLVVGPHVFLCTEQGIASCVEAASGKVIWQERLKGTFTASPVCAGQAIYCVSDEGDVVVLSAADKFAVLARNLLGERTHASPALAGGRIYFRTSGHLISLGGKK